MSSAINAFVWSSFFVAGTMALIVKFAGNALKLYLIYKYRIKVQD